MITDFGLAKRTEELDRGEMTASGAILGTPNYLSPEQAEGRNAEVGPATDVHALGMMLYQLATGELPFRGRSAVEVMSRIVHEKAPSPRTVRPDLPRALEQIIVRCLAKRPADRFASARELAEQLDRFLEGQRSEPTRARRRWWPFS